jgi:nucleoside-diphosphate-sugar epimerase
MNSPGKMQRFLKDRRCLVTGAGGFIGTALCARLKSLGAEVHAYARNASEDASIGACDVTDLEAVRSVFGRVRPQLVFHLASKVSGARSVDLVLPTLHSNLIGTVHVLLTALEHEAPKVVCMGSLQEPDQQLPAVPNCPYAAAKFASSAYARMFADVLALPVIIARPFMVYGAGQLDLTKLVPNVLTQILLGREVAMSSGAQSFDWIYIDDVVDALLAAAEAPGAVGKTIDIGWGTLASVRDVATGLATRLGRVDALRFGALPDRRLEPTRHADIQATSQLIDWRPRVPLDEGLDRAVSWYRQRFGGDPARAG